MDTRTPPAQPVSAKKGAKSRNRAVSPGAAQRKERYLDVKISTPVESDSTIRESQEEEKDGYVYVGMGKYVATSDAENMVSREVSSGFAADVSSARQTRAREMSESDTSVRRVQPNPGERLQISIFL